VPVKSGWGWAGRTGTVHELAERLSPLSHFAPSLGGYVAQLAFRVLRWVSTFVFLAALVKSHPLPLTVGAGVSAVLFTVLDLTAR